MENYQRVSIICYMKLIPLILLLLLFHNSLYADNPPGSLYEQSILDTVKKIQNQDHEQALSSTLSLS